METEQKRFHFPFWFGISDEAGLKWKIAVFRCAGALRLGFCCGLQQSLGRQATNEVTVRP